MNLSALNFKIDTGSHLEPHYPLGWNPSLLLLLLLLSGCQGRHRLLNPGGCLQGRAHHVNQKTPTRLSPLQGTLWRGQFLSTLHTHVTHSKQTIVLDEIFLLFLLFLFCFCCFCFVFCCFFGFLYTLCPPFGTRSSFLDTRLCGSWASVLVCTAVQGKCI